MVVAGEKTPAFSATTLTLPPEQIDNTGRIIENTRRLYSRNRAEVEEEISKDVKAQMAEQAAGNSGGGGGGQSNNRAPQRPQSQSQAKQWPIDAGAKAVSNTIRPPEAPQNALQNAPRNPIQGIQQLSVAQNNDGPAPATAFGSEGDAPVKKKRKRTRKRKPSTGANPADGQNQAPTPPTAE